MQRKEKNFALFFRQDQRSLLPNLMKISRDWNERKDAGDQPLESPLRTVLLGCLLKELLARLPQVVATEPGRAALLKSKWIDDQGAWRYMRWSPKEKRLVVDETREALGHSEAARVLGSLHSLMRGSIIQRFSSTMALWKLPRNCPSGQRCGGSPHALQRSLWLGDHELGRFLHEGGRHATTGTCEAPGSHHLHTRLDPHSQAPCLL